MPEQKSVIVDHLQDLLKANKIDIKNFNFPNFVKLVDHIASCNTDHLKVYHRYLNQALVENFFSQDDVKHHYESLFKVLHVFALHGVVEVGVAYTKFLLEIMNNLKDMQQQTTDKMLHRNLIDIIWTLICVDY